jgi:hypothetical protein
VEVLALDRGDACPNSGAIAAVTMALAWRAVLCPANFTVDFVGGSGVLKTSTAAVVLQHFAPGHRYDELVKEPVPLVWDSTAGGIELMRHNCKDALLLIDDFVADGADAARVQAKGASIRQSTGNGMSKTRMQSDLRQAPTFPPRTTLLSTGEHQVERRSAAGRSLLVRFLLESVHRDTLRKLQAHATAGRYAGLMAAYVQHLAASGIEAVRRLFRDRVERRLREVPKGGHSRTPAIIAELAAAHELVLEWGVSLGLAAADDAERLRQQVFAGLCSLVDEQGDVQAEADEGERAMGILRSLLARGLVYLADPGIDSHDQAPKGFQRVAGWRRNDDQKWFVPTGAQRVGWTDGKWVKLDEIAAWTAISQEAGKGHQVLPDKQTIRTRWAEKGWLKVSRASGRNRLIWTRKLGGQATNFLWIEDADVLFRLRAAADEAKDDAGPAPGPPGPELDDAAVDRLLDELVAERTAVDGEQTGP